MDTTAGRDQIQSWADDALERLTQWKLHPDSSVSVEYIGRGVGFPQTVNDQPAEWHMQQWKFELTFVLAREDDEAVAYEIAGLVKAAVDSDRSLGGRVRDAWVPIENVQREIEPTPTAEGHLEVVVPLTLGDLEAGPAGA